MAIYRVEVKVKETQETRLVEATNMATALWHIACQFATVTKCTTAEAVELGGKGVKVEKASNGSTA